MTDPAAAKLRSLFEIGSHDLSFVGRSVISVTEEMVTEDVRFQTGSGEPVRTFLTRPPGNGPFPAVLYIHAHGNRYQMGADELTDGRPALQGPWAPVLAGMGIAALCIDLPTFGLRNTVMESAAAKARLWHGRSLAGQMLGELSSALDWLAAQPEIDAGRIGVHGISMGATYAYWLAAVDTRLRVVSHQCCYADFDALIAAGNHDLHGIYLTIPGLLDAASNGRIAGLIAPRPQLICIGDDDPLTPPAAVDVALAQTSSAYGHGPLEVLRQAGVRHTETPDMRAATVRFLERHLVG